MAIAHYDLFISYAHADDETPFGATKGWVTTLADELNKVLHRKLGGSGARVWMDHQLAANSDISSSLLDTLRSSRTLLLVMSPGYQASSWCPRELGNFLARSAVQKTRDNVFIVEIEPVTRDSWHQSLQSLNAIRFWHREFEDDAPRLLGFPAPKPDENNPYWRNVNELAHLIAEFLRRGSTAPTTEKQTVLLAETTEDLLDSRESVVAFLRQQGYEILPLSDYPRDSEAAYVEALALDLSRTQVFAQLLGPHEGRKPTGGDTSFVALQTRQAMQAQARGSLKILQWRNSEIEPGQIASATYRELLTGRYVQASGLEDFKQQILQALASTTPPRDPPRPQRESSADDRDLYIYINTDQVDRVVADSAGSVLESLGVSVSLSPEPEFGQTPEQIRLGQQAQLDLCDGVLIVYGEAPATWVQSQFAFARQVVARKKRGVWGALLDVAPRERPLAPVKSQNLLMLDCRQGIDQGKLAQFVEILRTNGGAVHA